MLPEGRVQNSWSFPSNCHKGGLEKSRGFQSPFLRAMLKDCAVFINSLCFCVFVLFGWI